MSDIGQRLREIRKSRGLTQKDVADAIGVHELTIRRYEKDRKPTVAAVTSMAALFGVNPGYLLGVEDESGKSPVPQNPLNIVLTPQDVNLLKIIYNDPDGVDLVQDLTPEEGKILIELWKGLRKAKKRK